MIVYYGKKYRCRRKQRKGKSTKRRNNRSDRVLKKAVEERCFKKLTTKRKRFLESLGLKVLI